MKIQHATFYARSAFTLMEVAVTSAILGVIFVTFYAGIGSGFSMVALSRENLRANQILLDKMETVRLYSWSQINSNGFIPPTFTAPFDAAARSNTNGSAVTYYGVLTFADAPIPANYSTNLKLVTVSLTWTNGKSVRVRSMQTLVSEFGLQTYIY